MTFLNAQIGALFCFSSCWHAWVAWVCATQEWPVRGLCMNNYNSLVLFSWTVISFSLGFICCFQGDQGNSFSIVLFYQSLKWLCLPACHHLVWFAVFLAKWFLPQYSQIMLYKCISQPHVKKVYSKTCLQLQGHCLIVLYLNIITLLAVLKNCSVYKCFIIYFTIIQSVS